MAKGSELLAEESDSFFSTPCSVYKEKAQNFISQRCKSGTATFEKLHNKALSFFYFDTRRQDCLQENLKVEFLSAVENAAKREGWHSNCLLNSRELLALVCHKYFQGYSDSTAIIGQLRNPDLTADMVLNFLTRCPEPPITPKSKTDTCMLFCFQFPISQIAMTLVLKEYQVNKRQHQFLLNLFKRRFFAPFFQIRELAKKQSRLREICPS